MASIVPLALYWRTLASWRCPHPRTNATPTILCSNGLVPPRVLITRAPHQASALAEAVRAVGFEPILIPTIEIAPPTSFGTLDASLADLSSYHWLIFTSSNAVESFFHRQQENSKLKTRNSKLDTQKAVSSKPPILPGEDENQVPQGFSLGSHHEQERKGALAPEVVQLPANLRIAAIGPATARALEPFGIKPELVPPQAIAESLATALTPHARHPDGTPTRFLVPASESARNILSDTLIAAGAEVTVAPVYRNSIPADSIPAISELFSHPASYPDAITFTSGSTVTNLLALLEAANLTLPPEPLRISIGPITSAVLRDHGLSPHAEAEQATIPALVEKLSLALTHIKSQS